MAIDVLQLKIKKCANTQMLDLSVFPDDLPKCLMEEFGNTHDAYKAFVHRMLTGLSGEIAAVRFQLHHFSLLGESGILLLSELLKLSASLDFYTVLSVTGLMSYDQAEFASRQIWGPDGRFPCDAVMVSGYPGSDIVKPFLPYCEKEKKDLFVVVRSPNKSASELQDLLTGYRTVHVAAADYVNRYGANTIGKYEYSRVGIAVSATSGDSVRQLRSKYPSLFMVIDGLDQPGANAKNCSYGFDKLGHGSVVCLGRSVTSAWSKSEYQGSDFVSAALDVIRKNNNRLSRYVTVL